MNDYKLNYNRNHYLKLQSDLPVGKLMSTQWQDFKIVQLKTLNKRKQAAKKCEFGELNGDLNIYCGRFIEDVFFLILPVRLSNILRSLLGLAVRLVLLILTFWRYSNARNEVSKTQNSCPS